jgi:tetratricopeptide (TPR) repeat protein
VTVLTVLLGLGLGWMKLAHRRERQEALRLAEREDFDRAEPALRRVLERSPEDVAVLQALAQGYLAEKKLSDAEACLNRLCALQPGEVEPFRLRMEMHRQREQYEQALADGRRVLELDPDDLALRQRVAGFCFSAGRFEEAEREYRRCLEAQPNAPELLTLLAQARQAQGDQAGAAALLDRVLAAHPQFTRALMARAILYDTTGEPAKAIPLFRQVLALDKGRQRTARYQLSLALERVGQSEEARRVMAEVRNMQDAEVLDVASKVQPDNLDLQVQAARAQLAVGATAAGLKMLEDVLARDPNQRAAHAVLADHFERTGQADRADRHRRAAATPP